MHLAIVGAGMAGLAAAHRLRQARPEIELTILEASRAVGGRAATRRAHGAVFDHGAQYIKAPSAELLALLHTGGIMPLDIPQPVWTFDASGAIAPGDPEQNREGKWTYADGITRLARQLAAGLNVRYETRVARLELAEHGYRLYDPDGAPLLSADRVLLTPPAPESAQIVAASALPDAVKRLIRDQLDMARYRPCLTLTLGYDALRERPYYALVNTDKRHAMSWLAIESLKPGRESGGYKVLVAQLGPAASEQLWDEPLQTLSSHVAGLLSHLLDEDLGSPAWADRQGWRYALPDGGADFTTLNRAVPGLLFAGDYTAGVGRVHRAIEEGWRAAELLRPPSSAQVVVH